MYISYVRIENFRNFRSLEVNLRQNAVIVGENTAGKSNFLEALRLLLDPSLSDQERILSKDDFWDGAPEEVPAYHGTCIEVTVRLSQLDEKMLSLLYDATIPRQPEQPPVAEISYRFEPKTNIDVDPEDAQPSHYTFQFYRRSPAPLLPDGEQCEWLEEHEPIRNISEIRQRLVFLTIPALRDIESGLSSWRRSPLRKLIERMQLQEDDAFLGVVDKLQENAQNLREIPSVQNLETDVDKRLFRMLRGLYEVSPRLGFAPADETRLSHSLRLFIDGESWRPVSAASLGIANVLFLCLLTLDAEKRREEENEFVVLGVEEPEAHLHPHLQRLVFRDYFDTRCRTGPAYTCDDSFTSYYECGAVELGGRHQELWRQQLRRVNCRLECEFAGGK